MSINKGSENNPIQNTQESNLSSKQIPLPTNLGQRTSDINPNNINVADVLKQRQMTDINKYTEMMNMPFSKKKSQSKSRIEVRCSISSGPISPYTIFLKYMHNLLSNANKDLTFSQRAVLISNLWAMMSEKDKEPFKYSANMVNSNMK